MSIIKFCKKILGSDPADSSSLDAASNSSKSNQTLKHLLKFVKNSGPCSIVEVGLGDLSRTIALLNAASKGKSEDQIHYCGIDLFDARPEKPLSLISVHRELKKMVCKVKLVPGDPFSGIARTANELMNTDMIVISSEIDSESMDQARFYLPRMVHADSLIFEENRESGEYMVLKADQLNDKGRSKKSA